MKSLVILAALTQLLQSGMSADHLPKNRLSQHCDSLQHHVFMPSLLSTIARSVSQFRMVGSLILRDVAECAAVMQTLTCTRQTGGSSLTAPSAKTQTLAAYTVSWPGQVCLLTWTTLPPHTHMSGGQLARVWPREAQFEKYFEHLKVCLCGTTVIQGGERHGCCTCTAAD